MSLSTVLHRLTLDSLRYIVGINNKRTLLQTLWPSEPILAFAAGHHLPPEISPGTTWHFLVDWSE